MRDYSTMTRPRNMGFQNYQVQETIKALADGKKVLICGDSLRKAVMRELRRAGIKAPVTQKGHLCFSNGAEIVFKGM